MIAAMLSKLSAKIIMGVALIAALIVLGTCQYQRIQAAQQRRAEIAAELARAYEAAGKGATDASISAIERGSDREKQSEINREKINEAENAKDSAGAAGDVGFGVLCQRASYRNHPACLQRPHPASVAR